MFIVVGYYRDAGPVSIFTNPEAQLMWQTPGRAFLEPALLSYPFVYFHNIRVLSLDP